MVAGIYFFFVLFSFLVFLFTVFIISLFKKEKKYGKMSSKVSILIPAYNAEKTIIDCINAIKRNTFLNFELIVIDDGSKDETVTLLQENNVSYYKRPHLGKVDALNYGLEKTTGELILTVDADTFVEKNYIEKMIAPFSDEKVAATSGAVVVKNKGGLLGLFQNIEYHQNNLIRRSFSKVFSTGIWFFGCLACYRKDALEEINGFPKDTLAEDMDVAMVLKSRGYKTINVSDARGYTDVPTNLIDLYWQRSRWWVGGLQSLVKNRKLLHIRSNPSVLFLFINHFWWAFYAFISFPLFIYQINYWMPERTIDIILYLLRWFSIWGPFYVLYKIPEWGLNFYNIFGVLSGVLSLIMISAAIIIYKDKFSWRNLVAMVFYFPYTIIINLIVALSVVRAIFLKKKYFIS